MRLSSEAHLELEEFLRAQLGRPDLELPPISIYVGRFARLLMRTIGMGAITFGRRVFVAPSLVGRDAEGRLTIPGWLLAHEAAHVLQYEERGYARFFRDYLRGYWRALRAGGGWNAAARTAAYLAIAEECAAREVERAYRHLKGVGGRAGGEGGEK
jgi:hypothetical protein